MKISEQEQVVYKCQISGINTIGENKSNLLSKVISYLK